MVTEIAHAKASFAAGVAPGHHVQQLRRHEREAGAQHAAADVRREPFTGAAQVRRKHARQIVAPETQLADREDAGEKHAPLRHLEAVRGGVIEHEHHHEQAGDLEHVRISFRLDTM